MVDIAIDAAFSNCCSTCLIFFFLSASVTADFFRYVGSPVSTPALIEFDVTLGLLPLGAEIVDQDQGQGTA